MGPTVGNIYAQRMGQARSSLDETLARAGLPGEPFKNLFQQAVQQTDSAADEASLAALYAQLSSTSGTVTGESPASVSVSEREQQLLPMIRQVAAQYGLDENLLRALVRAESNFDTTAVSSVGAQGLTQLMPGTAKSLGVSDPYDALQNLTGGAEYLAGQIERFGDVRLALAAYNCGPGRVSSLTITDPDDPTQYSKISEQVRGYVNRVLGYAGAYASGTIQE